MNKNTCGRLLGCITGLSESEAADFRFRIAKGNEAELKAVHSELVRKSGGQAQHKRQTIAGRK